MREERQRRGLAAQRLGARQRRVDHGAMAPVHPVEIADRHHGAVKRAGIDGRARSMDDVKGLGTCGEAHGLRDGKASVGLVALRVSMPLKKLKKLTAYSIIGGTHLSSLEGPW